MVLGKNRKYHNALMYTSLFFVTFAVMYFLYYIISAAPFGSGTIAVMDADIQYVDFFSYYKDILAGKNQVLYTLSNTLGGDTVAIFSYYLASPFNLLLAFFEKTQICTFINLVFALKISTAAVTMSIFLKNRFKECSDLFVVLLSFSYAFMHYNVTQASNIMWLDSVYMLPLMLLGVYYAVNHKKIALLSVSTALCILFNWYTAGSSCLFSIIWFFVELVLYSFDKTYKTAGERLKSLFAPVFCYGGGMIIAVMISAVTFLPTIYTLLGGKGANIIYNSGFFANIFSVVTNNHIGAISQQGNPSLFCGSVALLGCICMFFEKSISKKIKFLFGALLLFMILIFYWSPLYLLFSLFSFSASYWYRYSYLSVFTVISIAAFYFSKTQNKPNNKIFVAALSFSGLLIVCEYVKPTFDMMLLFYTVIFVLLLAFLLTVVNKTQFKLKKVCSVALCGLLLLELCLNTYFVDKRFVMYNEGISGYIGQQETQIKQLQQADSSMYRISQTSYRRQTAYNESLAYGFASNTGYTSCPNNNQLNFLDALGYRTEGNCITVADTSVLAADSLLGVKYVLSEYPINGLVEKTDIQKNGNKTVYENPYCLPMAFKLSSFQSKEYEKLTPFEYHNELYSQLFGKQVELYVKLSVQKTVSENKIEYKLNLPDGEYAVYGNIPYNASSNTTVNSNGKEFSYGGWLSPSVFYVPTEKRDKFATVTVSTDASGSFLEEQFYALDIKKLKEVTSEFQNNAVSDVVFDGTKINCSVNAETDEYLFMSVPYSKGWKISVNGEKVAPETLDGCMMIIPLKAGKNNVEMTYTVSWMGVGILITFLGIIALALWIFISKRPKLIKKLLDIINSEAVRYIVVGGCTTLVNFVVFTVLCKLLSIDVNISNVISVICSILFAYVTNKIFVFKSKCVNAKELLLEMTKFIGARIATMVIEVGGVFVLYTLINQNELIAKLETQIIVLISNYVISRFLVFKNRKERK